MNNKYKSLAKDTALFAISNFGSKILLFLLTPLYTAVLTTKDYGIADLINTTILFVYPVLTLAIADATLRFALDENESKSEVMCCSILFTMISALSLILLYPCGKFIDTELSEYFNYFVITYILFNINNCFANFIKGIGKTTLFALQGILQTLAIVISNILLLVIFKVGLRGYLISIIIGYIVPVIVVFFAGKLYNYIFPFRLSKRIVAEMLKYSIPMIPTLLAWSINSSIDKYMITGIVGISENGLYSAAHKIPTIVTTLLSIFLQAWQISAISNYKSDDESEYYTEIYKALDLISVVACTCLILCTKWIASLLFAKKFFDAWKFVPFLILAAVFSSNSGFLAAAYRAAKKTASLFISVCVGAVVNIVLNYILLKKTGTVGAAIATAVSFFFVWLVRIILVQKIVKIKINALKTSLTYLLLITICVIYTVYIPHAFIICLILGISLVLINLKDLIRIISKLFNTTLNFIFKRHKGAT